MKALLVGGGGQLGRALCERLGARVARACDRSELDVRDGQAVDRALAEVHPSVVFNASAYNNVDAAESEPTAALAVNAEGPLHLARACRRLGALFVHVSSDYVFDGQQRRPYREDDRTNPLSVYGVSKLAGELMVVAAAPEYLLVRTSGVFGSAGSRAKGGSFVERILARARAGQPVRVVTDQVFSPTYAPDLAAALVVLVERGARGLVHVTNEGSCSWHELATAAVEYAGLDVPIEPIRTADLGAPARRPAYSVLDLGRSRGLGLPPLRPFRDALREMLAS